MSHPVPTCHAADRLAGLQGLFDKADLLVVIPSPPTLGTQHIDLHSRRDLKARLKVKSSGLLANYTRRPPPEGDTKPRCLIDVLKDPSGNALSATMEIWCIDDLANTKGDSGAKMIAMDKMANAGGAPDGVIAFGTAGYRSHR